VREGEEAARGIFAGDFAGAIKSSVFGHIDIHAGDRGFAGFKVIDFKVKGCWSFANVGGNRGNILVHAGEGLVHDLGGALFFDKKDRSAFLDGRRFAPCQGN
jgi:hypothetical protein